MDWLSSLFNQNQGVQPLPFSTMNQYGLNSGGYMTKDPLASLRTYGNQNANAQGLFGIDGLTGMGALGLGMQGLGALGNLWGGMKQYGLARDSLNFQKDAFNKNFENQRKTINSQLEDRQRARVSASPGGGYAPVDEYMRKYGV